MLPLSQKILFLLFAAITTGFGLRGFYRLYRRIARGRADTDARLDRLPVRIWYALATTLTQSRTFRKRPVISFFHSFIFYGFVFYILVNLVDAVDGFVPLSLASLGLAGQIYVLLADVLSALVLVGVVALVIRRFLLPARHDFTFNDLTLLHPDVKQRYVTRDSIIVSSFILFHVGSRAIGAGAKLATEGPDHFAPFATLLSHLFTAQNAYAWRVFGYWGALGSVLAFLMYFPYSKHIHIFMAPAKYLVAREVGSGVLPAVELEMDAEEPKLGANKLEDLAWPRLLDAYACIQCNRCQDVCPATQTGKSLSPSALEINKRMELNEISKRLPGFESGAPSPNPLLGFALSPEAAWACTTCGACIDVCPVQDEPMLDIIDIRRQQVMIEGEFPAQLQSAFRGMERAQNPWGINHEKRLDWAEGLNVKTTDQNPTPDVLFWVGCAASYDPQSQKTARAFVQLLDHAGVDFAVLGKRECCTGDSARRAGNEYLYRQLADQNVTTLNEVRPKLIVATCPHCMNTVGKEYKQLGGDYKVMHHTQYLESLVAEGRLAPQASTATVAYHDPCYLGRHNGVYDAPRNVLNILSNDVVELPRNRENSFCCGAGGAQFWKEEEHGTERISDNRYREAAQRLEGAKDEKVLAVGCPFCKSMLESTPGKAGDAIAVRDIAELLLEGVQRKAGGGSRAVAVPAGAAAPAAPVTAGAVADVALGDTPVEVIDSYIASIEPAAAETRPRADAALPPPPERKKWAPKAASGEPASGEPARVEPASGEPARVEPARVEPAKLEAVPGAAPEIAPGITPEIAPAVTPETAKPAAAAGPLPAGEDGQPKRKAWAPKRPAAVEAPAAAEAVQAASPVQPAAPPVASPTAPEVSAAAAAPSEGTPAPVVRKAWKPKAAAGAAADAATAAGTAAAAPDLPQPQASPTVSTPAPAEAVPPADAAPPAVVRKLWKPKASAAPAEGDAPKEPSDPGVAAVQTGCEATQPEPRR